MRNRASFPPSQFLGDWRGMLLMLMVIMMLAMVTITCITWENWQRLGGRFPRERGREAVLVGRRTRPELERGDLGPRIWSKLWIMMMTTMIIWNGQAQTFDTLQGFERTVTFLVVVVCRSPPLCDAPDVMIITTLFILIIFICERCDLGRLGNWVEVVRHVLWCTRQGPVCKRGQQSHVC